ncbi:phosphate ABC transporter, inner membrane subunit PstC [Ruminiclostridium papyrosolvens DSM 2782]|uniref:Phosphate transport system permease protein n=1 Tax=Ruminiclostridium papyrosolvens DSM 2782 TaxID=588581 RepID=F1THV4_9FIRM|nr:phosphate ABC transporter permease subunit PstC [Ruminiclostridium papyrosolvens]EGD46086.1 phosphate ABC transporter, inner membrane subunit PstC [Ruminiclostridium papyrosolvens DSM 2782]WES32885.1 phosphate ABC transporter permease subunit PstC [Ruminiclostridium papyrosolvens DSM 2782]
MTESTSTFQNKKAVNSRIKRMRVSNVIARNILFLFAIITILTTIGIIASLLKDSIGFFSNVSITDFLFGRKWTPLFSEPSFGVLPLVMGTLIITLVSAVISIPIGLLTAIYLSEYANKRVRKIIKPILEVLAGIPSIVFGYFALTVITPLIKTFLPQTEIFNALSASIAVGIMTIPLVSSLSEDALRAVPDSLRQGALALGSTKMETSLKVVVPAAISGISASFVLAISRAIGETMIVTIAAGARPNLTFNPLESVQTMTSFIVQASQGDNPHGTVGYYSLFAVGLLLFLITLGLNILSHHMVEKYRKEY